MNSRYLPWAFNRNSAPLTPAWMHRTGEPPSAPMKAWRTSFRDSRHRARSHDSIDWLPRGLQARIHVVVRCRLLPRSDASALGPVHLRVLGSEVKPQAWSSRRPRPHWSGRQSGWRPHLLRVTHNVCAVRPPLRTVSVTRKMAGHEHHTNASTGRSCTKDSAVRGRAN